MRIGTNGIITNEFGQVLLIQRDDTRLLAPPGGAMEAGELPTDSVIREVREETGLIVMPVRLVAVYFWATPPDGFLSFVFRCLRRGGELQTSVESLQVGFFPTNPLPENIFSIHRERIEQGLKHKGGPVYWGQHQVTPAVRLGRLLLSAIVYPLKDLRRQLRGDPPYVTPPHWNAGALAVIRNREGKVLWVRRTDIDVWSLPGGWSQAMEPPWETIIRRARKDIGATIRPTDLSGVYICSSQSQMAFIFTADFESGEPTAKSPAEFAYFAPGEEPANAVPQQLEYVADAFLVTEETVFRRQESSLLF